MVTIGNKEFFKGIDKINFEGKNSKNPFAFKYYNPDSNFIHVLAKYHKYLIKKRKKTKNKT